MKKTFREKVIAKFTRIAKKHKILKYPCLAMMTAALGGYYTCQHFANNMKRYASVAFVILFFMNSCSFSFAVFAERSGFIKAQETYSAVVEDSDIVLAEITEVDPEAPIILDEEENDLEYDPEQDITNADVYTLDDILESHEEYHKEEEQPEEGAEGYVFDSSDWRLVLINKQHPRPDGYDFNLGTIKGSVLRCDERIIDDLLLMMQAAKDDGVNLVIRSPYRTLDRQEYLFNKKIRAYMNQGLSYMEAYKISSQAVTVPGSSEHQVGLALDITSDTFSDLIEEFSETEAGQWLAEHSCEYGFTLRYPEGKEHITSIEYEPWHFRYVGREAAMIMHEENICLEEFWDQYL